MPVKVKAFAESALVDPVTVNVGRAGAANLDVIQVELLANVCIFPILSNGALCKAHLVRLPRMLSGNDGKMASPIHDRLCAGVPLVEEED
jgi:hypothetical protein